MRVTPLIRLSVASVMVLSIALFSSSPLYAESSNKHTATKQLTNTAGSVQQDAAQAESPAPVTTENSTTPSAPVSQPSSAPAPTQAAPVTTSSPAAPASVVSPAPASVVSQSVPASMIQTISTQPRRAAVTTDAMSGTATAGNMAVSATPGAQYMSSRISQADAGSLYRAAGIAAAIGFAVYAATMLPHKPGRINRFMDKVRSPQNVKINHS